jgi:hypothetical protein
LYGALHLTQWKKISKTKSKTILSHKNEPQQEYSSLFNLKKYTRGHYWTFVEHRPENWMVLKRR